MSQIRRCLKMAPGTAAAPNSRQKILMCAPDNFGVDYVINPWMLGNRGRVNHALSVRQWNNLRDALAAHAEITLIEPQPNLPDMVFTANAGMVLGNVAVASRFRYSARQGEEPFFCQWFEHNGFPLAPWPGIFFSKVPAMPCSIAASLSSGADSASGPMKLRRPRTNAFSNAPSSVCGLSIRAFTISTLFLPARRWLSHLLSRGFRCREPDEVAARIRAGKTGRRRQGRCRAIRLQRRRSRPACFFQRRVGGIAGKTARRRLYARHRASV